MKRLIFILLMCLFGLKSFTQVLNNKAELYLGIIEGDFCGSELFNDEGTIAPAFYSNFKNLKGLEVKGLYNLSPFLSAGLSIDYIKAGKWRNENYTSYLLANSSIMSFSPLIQCHSTYKFTGIYNRLKFYGELSPVFGVSMSSIPFTGNLLTDAENTTIIYLNENTTTYGLRFGLGSSYELTDNFGLYLNLNFQKSYLKSHLFIDSSYTISYITVGTFLSLSKIKRFNYE